MVGVVVVVVLMVLVILLVMEVAMLVIVNIVHVVATTVRYVYNMNNICLFFRDFGKGLDENYCRNPDNTAVPWCYTNLIGCARQYCDPCRVGRLPTTTGENTDSSRFIFRAQY